VQQDRPDEQRSGEAGGQTKEHCKQLGAFAYIEKPIDFDVLRTCLTQLTKTRRFTPRSEVRVRLRVQLKLRWTDKEGKKIDQETATEDVSLSGFLCTCTSDMPVDSVVEVYLTTSGPHYVGKAKVVHSDTKAAPLCHYGFRFIEKTGPWVLD